MTEEQFWARIQYQRSLGISQVSLKLDQMCEDLGLDRHWWRYETRTWGWDHGAWRQRYILGVGDPNVFAHFPITAF